MSVLVFSVPSGERYTLSTQLFVPVALFPSLTTVQTMFTGPLVLGLTIVGIVIGGAMIMFGGGMAMRAMGGILLGGVLILDAVKIATYLQSAI